MTEDLDTIIAALRRARRASVAGNMDYALNTLESTAIDCCVLFAQWTDPRRLTGFEQMIVKRINGAKV